MNTFVHIMGAVALGGWLLRLAGLVALHVVPSDYHPVRHAVSDYAVGPTRQLTARLAVVTALAWFGIAASCWLALPEGSDRTFVAACAGVNGLLSLLMPAFPTDLEGQRLTFRGVVHYGLAIAQFALAYTPMGNLVRAAEALHWPSAGALNLLSVASLVCLVATCATMVGPGRRIFGLTERSYLAAVLVFYGVVAASLMVG